MNDMPLNVCGRKNPLKKNAKACLAILTALLLLPSFSLPGARADRLSDLAERYESGAGVELCLGLSLAKVPGMSDGLMEKVNAWLAGTALRVQASAEVGRDNGRVLLTFDGDDVIDVWTGQTEEGALTVFGATGRAYFTEGPGFGFLESMTGDNAFPMPLPGWEDALYFRLLPRFYELLEGAASQIEPKEDSVRVKSVGTSPLQTVCVLSADEMNGVWPQMTAFFRAGSAALLAYRTLAAENALSGLDGVAFTDTVTVTRLFDGDGMDMGVKVTGRCLPGDGSERKITLTAGFKRNAALYISLSMPSVKGSLSDKLVLTLTKSASGNRVTWNAEGSVSRTDPSGTVNLDLSGSVKETLGDTDVYSGKIVLSGRVRGIRKSWTLRPDFTADGEGVRGGVRLTVSTAGETDTDVTVTFVLAPCEAIVMPESAETVDCSALSETEMEALLLREALPLTRVWLLHMAGLTYEEREGIAHVLRDGEWMNGPVTVAPPEGAPMSIQDNEWSVEEDSQ